MKYTNHLLIFLALASAAAFAGKNDRDRTNGPNDPYTPISLQAFRDHGQNKLQLELVASKNPSRIDRFGNHYRHWEQRINGTPVLGAALTEITTSQGKVFRFGRIAPHPKQRHPKTVINAQETLAKLAHWVNIKQTASTWIYYPAKGETRFALFIKEESFDSRWRIVVDARNGKILNAWNQRSSGSGQGVLGDTKQLDTTYAFGTWRMVSADGLVRTYDNNNIGDENLPGALFTDTDDVWTDGAAVDAHFYASQVLAFYLDRLNRVSFDGTGSNVVSTVHYTPGNGDVNNAFWNGFQMVYGDGDGFTALPLSGGFDVVAHEITHALTEHTSNLIYQGESGALNEAFSDIMGTWAEYAMQSPQADWTIAEDVWTPLIPGDALRYMNNPTADGSSKDHYADRYQGSLDQGGVHINSGIANLAFYLASEGGVHPRRSSQPVPGLGIETAGIIFYEAFTSLPAAATFADARSACEAIAASISQDAQLSVALAWAAVGVGVTESEQPVLGTELQNGVASDPQTGLEDQEFHFHIDVPADAAQLNFVVTGGDGDADLYIRFGNSPTLTSYDFRPYLFGNEESVTIPFPAAGTYYVMLRGYKDFSNTTLTASYQTPAGGTTSFRINNGETKTGLSAAKGETLHYFSPNIPNGATNLTISISGGSGDADLYVRAGQAPTAQEWDYRPYMDGNEETVQIPTANGEPYYIMLRGFAEFSEVSLSLSWDAGSGGGNATVFNGQLPGNGEDNYDLAVTGGIISLSASFTDGSDIDLYLYDPAGNEVASATTVSNPETLTYDAGITAGTFRVRVYNYSSGITNYTLTVTTE